MPIIVWAVVMMGPVGGKAGACEPVASSSVTITEQGDFLQVRFGEGSVLDDFVGASKPYLVPPRMNPSRLLGEAKDAVLSTVCVDPESLDDLSLGLHGARRVSRRDFWAFFRNLVSARGIAFQVFGSEPHRYILLLPRDSDWSAAMLDRGCRWRATFAPVILRGDLPAYADDDGLIITTVVSLRVADPKRTVDAMRNVLAVPEIGSVRAVANPPGIVVTGEAPAVYRQAAVANALGASASSVKLLRRLLGAALTTPMIGGPTLPGYPPPWDAPPWLVPTVTIAEEGECLRVEIAEGATAWDLVDASKPFLAYPRLRSDPGDLIAPSDVVCAVDVEDRSLDEVESIRIDRRELWSFFVQQLSRVGLKPVVYGRGYPGSYVGVVPSAREVGSGQPLCFGRTVAQVVGVAELLRDRGLDADVVTAVRVPWFDPRFVADALDAHLPDEVASGVEIRPIMQSGSVVVRGKAVDVCAAVDRVVALNGIGWADGVVDRFVRGLEPYVPRVKAMIVAVVARAAQAVSTDSPVTIVTEGDYVHVEFAEGAVLGDFLRSSRPRLLSSPNLLFPPPSGSSEGKSRSIFFELGELESVAVGIRGVRRVHARDYCSFFRSLMSARGVALWRTFDGSGVAIGLTSLEIAEARQKASRRMSCSRGTVAPVIGLDDLPAYSADAGLIVTTSMGLKSAHPEEVVNRLQSTFSDPMISSIRAVMQSRAIVMTGEAPQVCRAVEAVKLLDAAASAPDLIWDCTTSAFR